MVDLIQMNCPSCGGQLQAQRDMQKMFCMHCGTELMLKYDEIGSLIPIQAREIQASAKLKEIQFSMAAVDLVRSQIAELETKFSRIRNWFLTNILPIRGVRCFKDYEKENQIYPSLADFATANWNNWFNPEWDIRGYTTMEDFLNLYSFLQRPQYQKNKYLLPILKSFEPLPSIAEELQVKKAQLNRMLDQAIENH